MITLAQTGNQFRSPSSAYRRINLTVSAKLEEPVSTRIFVQKGEYVFIESQDEVVIGQVMGKVYADGVPRNRSFSVFTSLTYNKYSCRHGSLVVRLNNQIYPFDQLFSSTTFSRYNSSANPFLPAYASSKFVIKRTAAGLEDYRYVPGVYFIAPEAGELSIDLNDKKVDDNEGQFRLTVYTMTTEEHFARNQFNRCPAKEPVDNKDCMNNRWQEESSKSFLYHGYNDAFRGIGKFGGCQCVYDEDELIQSETNQGSFDFGYWLVQGNQNAPLGHYFHLVLDVVPHDLFDDFYGGLQYSNSIVMCAGK